MPFTGHTRFIVGVPIKKVGRLARVTCSYGVVNGKPSYPVEIGLSKYSNASSASSRVKVTIQTERAGGATFKDLTVDGKPATLLQGTTGSLLVYAVGVYTIALSVDASAHAPDPQASLAALAEVVQTNLKSLS
ncbi:MAG: hypothetical protein ACR2F6_14190 [Mycobacteriales bacterium]